MSREKALELIGVAVTYIEDGATVTGIERLRAAINLLIGTSAGRSAAPVSFTKEDWREIYYALDFKLLETQNDKEWARHLKSIMDAIGPDGATAAERGTEGK